MKEDFFFNPLWSNSQAVEVYTNMQCRLEGQGALQRPQIMQKMRSRYGRLHQSTGSVEPGCRRSTDLQDFGSKATLIQIF